MSTNFPDYLNFEFLGVISIKTLLACPWQNFCEIPGNWQYLIWNLINACACDWQQINELNALSLLTRHLSAVFFLNQQNHENVYKSQLLHYATHFCFMRHPKIMQYPQLRIFDSPGHIIEQTRRLLKSKILQRCSNSSATVHRKRV